MKWSIFYSLSLSAVFIVKANERSVHRIEETLCQNTTKNEAVDRQRMYRTTSNTQIAVGVFIDHTIHYNELYWTFILYIHTYRTALLQCIFLSYFHSSLASARCWRVFLMSNCWCIKCEIISRRIINGKENTSINNRAER